MSKESGKAIFRSRYVVTMEGPPIENGAVALEDDRIVDVGRLDAVKMSHPAAVIDLGESVLLPGLINAHCHLDYTCLRGRIPPPGDSFTTWIRAINAEKAKLSPQNYIESIQAGYAEAKRFGTVALANLTAFPELIAKVQPLPRTTWFSELIDVRSPENAEELISRASEDLRFAERSGLAPHALFTASEKLYRLCGDTARQSDALLTTHLAESRDEMEMFRDGGGPLYRFMKEIGRNMSDCGSHTPLARFLSFANAAQPWLIVHLNELTESDFALLEEKRPAFSIVHCPRSHDFFGHTPFAWVRLTSLGFEVALGTDSLASNDDLSLFAEMRAFQRSFPNVAAEEILKTTTINAAKALGASATLGRLGKGSADAMIAVPFKGSAKGIYEEILAFDGTPWTNG
jgi:cytosine/adenosine deaminase-related metal-dependent hydrolase